MFVITRVVLVIVPSAFVCGIVSVVPTRNGAAEATVSVAVLTASVETVDSRGGHASGLVAHDPGLRLVLDAVVLTPHRYFVNQRLSR